MGLDLGLGLGFATKKEFFCFLVCGEEKEWLAWMSDPGCCCSRAGSCEPCHHPLETVVLLKCF